MKKKIQKRGITSKKSSRRVGYTLPMTPARRKLDAYHVAEYFLYLAKRDKKPLSNKKLQKLVYYAQAWSLVLLKSKIFSNKIEAWVHGPAVRSLYGEYKEFGFSPIEKEISQDTIKVIPKKAKELLDQVWRIYGKFDAQYLEFLSHSEAPWLKAREGMQLSESSSNEISLKTMKSFYTNRLKEAEAEVIKNK